MKILIRADGSNRIGMGHVMRMLVLADSLAEFAEVVFVCRDKEEFQTGVKYIIASGYTVLKVPEDKVVEKLRDIGGKCLITDSYDVDESYFYDTKNCFDVTGYMDDLNMHCFNTDFIINQNIYAEDLKYKTDPSTKLFLGTQYALLRKEFQGIPERETSKGIKNVLITLGGSDPNNLISKIAVELNKAFPEIKLHIAAGLSVGNRKNLQSIENNNIIVYSNPKMSELMVKCDAAVSACGSTIYELCACGTPVIGMVTADNQLMVAEKMNNIGAMKYAVNLNEVIQHMENLDFETRVSMSKKCRGLVDGNGSVRLAQELKKMLRNHTKSV